MKIKSWYSITAVLLIFLAGISFFIPSETESFTAFENYLLNHPFYNRTPITRTDLKAIPKADRPDLAWEQDFLLTMDPKEKRPTPEVLKETQIAMEAYFNAQIEKGVPGSSTYPWIERGPANVGGRTRGIMWDVNDPAGKKVWAGGVTGGLWYNDDITSSSSNWIHVDDFWDNLSITAIATSPMSADTMYVGTGEGWGANAAVGAGVWKSTDGGVTWNQIPSTSNLTYVNDLVIRKEGSSGVVYAATGRFGYKGATTGSKGLYRSTDGINFNEVFPGSNDVASIKIAADNSLWAGTRSGSVYQSIDGTTWVQKHNITGRRTAIAVAPSNPDVVYALYENGNKVSGIYRTLDGGDNWSQLTEPADADNGIPVDDFSRGQAWYDLVIAVDPNDEDKVIVGGVDLFVSSDGGSNWSHLSKWSNNNNLSGLPCSVVHADQHAIVFKPGSSEEVIFGNDGGVFHTSSLSNAPTSNVIRSRNKNYNVTQFYACAINPNAGSGYALAGAQDNGTQKFATPGFTNTSMATSGDGAYCFIDQDNPQYQMTSYVYNNFYLSTNGGGSFFTTLLGQNNGSFINPADYDDQENILYSNINSNSFYRVSDVSGTKLIEQISASFGSSLTNLKASPFAAPGTSNLYVGTASGRVYKMDNVHSGTTQTPVRIENGLSSGSVSSIEFGATEDQLLVTFANYGVISVWYTNDGGTNWKNKEGNLPNFPVRWGLINPNDNNEVILATELGVWASYNFQDASPIWEPSNKGLANVRVDMLQMRSSDNTVIAATHGRGLFESNGFNNPTLVLNALFTANSTTVNVGVPVVFTDESTVEPKGWDWSFPGGSPSSYVGQNPPSVSYQLPGCYDVTLTVNNDFRDTTRTKLCFINVGLFDGPCEPETTSGTEDGDFIDGVQLEAINNVNTGSQNGPYYNNYTSQYATLELGNSYSITLFSGTSGPNDFIVWIDYNGDNSLQDPEERIGLKTLGANSSGSINLTVPTTIPDGFRVMRIKAVYNSNENTSPCSDNEWGEVEDYGIYFIDNINPPNVDFDVSQTLIAVGESVNFTDRSTATPYGWDWDLADGLPATSTDQHPANVVYNNPGCKTISLQATNNNGSGSKVIPCAVEVIEPPVSLFSASDTIIEVGSLISFNDLSLNNPDTWTWDFNGAINSASSLRNPVNIKYNNVGCFPVTLTTSYKGISREPLVKTCYITVIEKMVTSFSATALTIQKGSSVDFIDQTVGDPTNWDWQFEGAATTTSTDQHPSNITYNSSGCFKVSLAPSREGNQGMVLEKNCYINVVNPLEADFIADKTYTRIGEPVNFYDQTPGTVTNWYWTFGGSLTTSSTSRFPTIVFDTVGCFPVSLIAYYNGLESDPEIKTCYIEVDYGVGVFGNQKKSLNIYPIPANEFLILDGMNENQLFEIFAISGQKMQVPTEIINNSSVRLETANLSNGIYFIRWLEKGTMKMKKLIVEH
jgi:PKD repeat protein